MTAAIPAAILKFEGELTPEQLAMWRVLWEAAVDLTEPEGFRVWKAGVAHGRTTERERIRQLAIKHNVTWQPRKSCNCGRIHPATGEPCSYTVGPPQPFADLLDGGAQ